ncbi:MAG: methyltransferase domain-containing protein [Actinomycetota bacterium]|nr:methyltransferase domain-containing protein [Actinomycetota bacterium]
MINYLDPVMPVQYGVHGLDGANSPMRRVTRQVAFESAWDNQRADKVRDLFDGMADHWHERVSPDRGAPLADAIDRGDVQRGLTLELGSGIGDSTAYIEDHVGPTVSADLAMEMLIRAPTDTRRVRADASRLPFADGLASSIVLINALLFPAEVDRVLAAEGTVVWVNTSGENTPIFLSSEDLVEALPGAWAGVASRADRGTWAVLRRAST